MVQELDAIDIKILRLLQDNCKLTIKEIAEKINLSTTPAFERQKRLEKAGFIQKYVAVLDSAKLGRGFMVFCNVSMRQINKDIAEDFAAQVTLWPEVSECYNVSGDCDYLLKICVNSMQQYQEFILNKIGTFNHIAHIQSVFVMGTLKQSYGVPL